MRARSRKQTVAATGSKGPFRLRSALARHALVLALWAGGALSLCGCVIDHDIAVDVVHPGGLSILEAGGAYALFVHKASSCGSLEQTSVADGNYVHMQFFRSTGVPVGVLDEGTYAFVAFAYDATCDATYSGCTVQDADASDSVVIQLSPIPGDEVDLCGDLTCGCANMTCGFMECGGSVL